MRALRAVLAISLGVPLHALGAQEPPPVEPGTRVRVTAPAMALDKVRGTWVAAGVDTIQLRIDLGGTVLAVPVASVARIEVWTGRRSHLLAGAAIGLLVGASVGVATVATTCTPDVDCFGAGVALFGYPAAGAVLGGIAGAFLWRTDRWEEVLLDETRIVLAPLRDGRLALGVSVSF